MATRGGLSALAIAEIGAGVILAWSGVVDASIPATLESLLRGQKPQTDTAAQPITGQAAPNLTAESGTAGQEINATAPGSGTNHANALLGQLMASGYGWGAGQNWQALNYGWGTLESGWNAAARNASGAFGIAQALGHGTSATAAFNKTLGMTINAYGPQNGVSVATARAANAGSAEAQIAWGLAYIHATYGSPDKVPGWLGQGGYIGY